MTVQRKFDSFQEAAGFARIESVNLRRDLSVRRASDGKWIVLCEDGTPIDVALSETKRSELETELAQALKRIGSLTDEVGRVKKDLAQHKKWLANAHADLDKYMPAEEKPPNPLRASTGCNACGKPLEYCICSR